jgi:hypothetical protein
LFLVVEEGTRCDDHGDDEEGHGLEDLWGYEGWHAACMVRLEFGLWVFGWCVTYGGRALFGRRSMRISPSLGGGIRFSGDQTLVGVFHGTTGSEASGPDGAVDAERIAATRRRHCSDCCGLVRERAANIRGGGILICDVQWVARSLRR